MLNGMQNEPDPVYRTLSYTRNENTVSHTSPIVDLDGYNPYLKSIMLTALITLKVMNSCTCH